MGISCAIFSDNSSLESSWRVNELCQVYSTSYLPKKKGPELTISDFSPCRLIGSGLREVAVNSGMAFGLV
jgi:hypothetical protein